MRAHNGDQPAIGLSALLAVAAACCPQGTNNGPAVQPQAVESERPELLRPQRIERRLSLGQSHGCLLDDEGGLGCWGSYISLEQLEVGLVGVEPPVVALNSRFGNDGCVVIEGGRVRCWNDDYEDPPWIVEGFDDAIALSDRCALRRTGEIACWSGSGLRPAAQDLTNVLDVVGEGSVPGCVRTSEGLGLCSTSGQRFELGATESGAAHYRDVIALASGRDSIWIARANGQVERCLMEARVCFTVDELAAIDEAVVELGALAGFVCARTRSGRVHCWSDQPKEYEKRTLAALGYWDPRVPIEIAGVEDAVELAVGSTHGCARQRDESVRCWGDNRWFQLGEVHGRTHLDAPTRILGLNHAAVDVAVGTRHACVRDDEGEVWCWGFRKALADDFDDLSPSPVHVAGSSDAAAVRVLVGADLSCSFHADGHANCVGDGVGTFVVCGDVLCSDGTKVMPALAVDSVVDLVDWWGCHADARGVSCFGHASYHAMDDMPSLGVYVSDAQGWRIHAPGKGRVIDIGIGAKHGCALLEDGRVYCWGLNGDGQLGREEPRRRSPASRDRALLVPGIAKLVSLDAGDAHTCGLDEQGTAWCWGANDHGQLGAPPSRRGAAVSVPNMPSLRALQVAELHACGLDHDGRVWCWGDDREGQLGDGPGIVGEGPRVIEGLPPIHRLAAAAGTTCAIDERGEVWCWGRNKDRQASTASPAWSLAAVELAPSRIVPIVGARPAASSMSEGP